MQCGNGADWKCLCVVLGMGEADCNVDCNLHLWIIWQVFKSEQTNRFAERLNGGVSITQFY